MQQQQQQQHKKKEEDMQLHSLPAPTKHPVPWRQVGGQAKLINDCEFGRDSCRWRGGVTRGPGEGWDGFTQAGAHSTLMVAALVADSIVLVAAACVASRLASTRGGV